MAITNATDGCNSTYRLRYWNIKFLFSFFSNIVLQQYLPFTVLKLPASLIVLNFSLLQQYLPFTVLKHVCKNVFGSSPFSCNSTYRLRYWNENSQFIFIREFVATVLTVYGIETVLWARLISDHVLQQYLPFTVLKLFNPFNPLCSKKRLQQYLPFTVLKPKAFSYFF